jgi:hypothetical protein
MNSSSVLLLLTLGVPLYGETFTINSIVPDRMPGDLELAVIPTPQESDWPDRMIRAGQVAIVVSDPKKLRAGKDELIELFGGPENVEFFTRQKKAEAREGITSTISISVPERAIAGGHREAYRLSIKPGEERHRITIEGNTWQACHWALQTLRQICYLKDSSLYIRCGRVTDWPVFPLRGCKRPQPWEHSFKSNFRYSVNGLRTKEQFQNHFMDRFIPDPFIGRELDTSEKTIEKFEEQMAQFNTDGATGYAFHVDDMPMKLSDSTQARFNGNYEAAIHSFLSSMKSARDRIDPGDSLYFIAQPYWTNTNYRTYADAINKAGGLPSDLGMILCGHEVTSWALPRDDIQAYREAFKTIRTKALIYDNIYDSTFIPVDARPAELAEVIDGVIPEQATATGRITRLDWGWNPRAYNPDRSLKLACRELAGLKHWDTLYHAIRLSDGRLPGPNYEPRKAALGRFKVLTRQLHSYLDKLNEIADDAGNIPGGFEIKGPAAVSHPFKGIIDDLGLFSIALSEDELDAIYEEGLESRLEENDELREAAVGIWLMDDPSSERVLDSAGRKIHAAVKGRRTRKVAGKHGLALRFPGNDGNSVRVPYRPLLRLNAFTITTWIKARHTGNYQVILHRFGKDDHRNYSLILDKEGRPYADVFPVPGVSANIKVTDDKWHHLAVTLEGRESRIYVDNRLRGTRQVKGGLSFRGDAPLSIGATSSPNVSRPKGYAYGVVHHLTDFVEGIDKHEATSAQMKNAYKEMKAVRLRNKIQIDGRMENAWSVTSPAGNFVIGHNGEPASEPIQLSVRAGYDAENLYLFITNRSKAQGEAELAKLTRRDRILANGLGPDHLIALLDPGHTHKWSYEFRVSRNGTMHDGRFHIGSAETPQGKQWNSGAKVATHSTAAQWTAELAIPLKRLGKAPASGSVWGINFWARKPGTPPLIWSHKIRWWGFTDTRQAGHLLFE